MRNHIDTMPIFPVLSFKMQDDVKKLLVMRRSAISYQIVT